MTAPKRKTYELIVEKIEAFFIEENKVPGDRLPSERELSSRFGVSRTSVREALKALEMAGFVEIRRGGGSYIKTPEVAMLGRQLGSLIEKTESHLAHEMLELRRALEVESASLAAQRAGAENLQGMRDALADMHDSFNDAESGVQADLQFHMEIVRASRNLLLIQMVETLANRLEDTIRATRRHRFIDASRHADTYAEHLAIYTAIAEQDPLRAKHLMERHIDQIMRELDAT